ncbi:molybdenum cofactor biosynthesis protein [Methylacidiphilum kamchatkense Kam1]|uniref:Cyclic pyranopterin monophosphate synthase subunit MoaA n=1 Tax=Methylacidiphilum kamchatkense Kam1 TaxID=1202785 RepID=A0A0C1RLG9_9BACT|nr:molybdenum cofactor biosynthesis protein [Methylacidiphilum kamchatkense Kam1]QDQ41674.1 cyclic pyranopterin monophosphate synthase subunit MoaA [Methylacidiphilum kamchatkense Kam1]
MLRENVESNFFQDLQGSAKVHYLRISVTDRCNERCVYCFPQDLGFLSKKENILSFEEIYWTIFYGALRHGFKDFRITGGEPLVRKGTVSFIEQLTKISKVRSVRLSTNGTLLGLYARKLKEANIAGVNVSLDCLNPSLYKKITGGDITPVLEGIDECQKVGIESVKINTVLLRGINEGEILPLIEWASEKKLVIRFIELMPISYTGKISKENFLSVAELKKRLEKLDDLEPLEYKLGQGPAKYFRMKNRNAIVGFIGAISDFHFCDNCNKMRLTSDGFIRPCLGNHLEIDIKPFLRPSIDPFKIYKAFELALQRKPPEHSFRDNYNPGRVMTSIGG